MQYMADVILFRLLGAPGQQDEVDIDLVPGLERDFIQIQGETAGVQRPDLRIGSYQRTGIGLAADGNAPILDDQCHIDIVVIARDIGVGDEGRLGAKRVIDFLGFHGSIGDDRLIIFIQVTELLVPHRSAIHGEYGEILTEGSEGDVLQHLHADLVVGAVLIGLRHLHVTIIHRNAAVI